MICVPWKLMSHSMVLFRLQKLKSHALLLGTPM